MIQHKSYGFEDTIQSILTKRQLQYLLNAFVAQMVERKTLNLVVVGSIPIEGVLLFCASCSI